jgi:thioredoxin 2
MRNPGEVHKVPKGKLMPESQTYAVCEKCKRLNRVDVSAEKQPICGACKTELPVHGAIIEGSDSTLQTLIAKSPLPVIIDVWAPWCGPCRAFAPTFEEFSRRYAGKAVFVKLNSDQNQQTSGALGIRGIPTILMFKQGAESTRHSGAMPPQVFGQWLDRHAQG